GHTQEIVALAFSPRGRTLVTASLDRTIKVWDPLTGRERGSFQGHADGVTALAFSPSGRQLATGSQDKSVKVGSPAPPLRLALGPRFSLTGHKNQVWFAVPSPDGTQLASGGDDGLVRLWQVKPDSIDGSYPLPGVAIGVAFSGDGKTLAVTLGNGNVH